MLSIAAAMVIGLFPLLKEVIANAGDENNMVQSIDAYGLKGVPLLICLQAFQIIIAFLPAAAIQILTGLCYGVWLGVCINLVGSILGNIIVFTAVRQFRSLFSTLFKRKKGRKGLLSAEKLARLKKPEMVAFFLFLIPGIPNGFVPYVFAGTDISLRKYLLAVAAGSIPATFLCTFLGDRWSKGSHTTAVVIAVVVAVVIVLVFVFKDKILRKITGARTDET